MGTLVGTFEKYPPLTHWVKAGRIVSEPSMYSAWTHWVIDPLPPVQLDPLRVWCPDRDIFLEEFMLLEGRMGFDRGKCYFCSNSGTHSSPTPQARGVCLTYPLGLYRCRDCLEKILWCDACIMKMHKLNPCHRVQVPLYTRIQCFSSSDAFTGMDGNLFQEDQPPEGRSDHTARSLRWGCVYKPQSPYIDRH